MKARYLAAILAFSAFASVWAGPFAKGAIYADPSSGVSDAALAAMLDRAFEGVELAYLPFFPQLVRPVGITVDLTLVGGSSKMFVVKASAKGGAEDTAAFFWSQPGDIEPVLAPTIFSMWAKFNGLADKARGVAPQPSLELSIKAAGSGIGLNSTIPQSIATVAPAPDGGLFLSCIGYFAELDSRFTPRAQYQVDAANPYHYFSQMAATASGSLAGLDAYGKPYYLRRGAESFTKGRATAGATSSLKITPSGSLVYFDTDTMSIVTIEGDKKMPLVYSRSGSIANPTLFDIDGEGNLWIYDYVSKVVWCFGQDGGAKQIIRVIPLNASWSPLCMSIRGSEILLSDMKGIMAFDRFGLPLWSMATVPSVQDGLDKAMLASVTVGSDGAIYALSMQSLVLTRFDDEKSLAAVRGGRGADEEALLRRMIELNAAVAKDYGAIKPQEERARFAEASLSVPVALSFRTAMAELFPDDATNGAHLAAIRQGLARQELQRLSAVVYQKLDRFGAETARADYQLAMAAYERYLAELPRDAEMATARMKLGDSFRAKEAGTAPFRQPSIKIEASFSPLFPAFAERYRKVPAGSVKLTNTGSVALANVTLTVDMKTFMDFPAELKLSAPLAPGASVDIPVYLVLNRLVLDLREELSVQVALSAQAAQAYGSASATLTMRSRTALTWEDTAALAAFISPNDEAVVAFVHAALALSPPPLFGRNSSKAFAIINALAARGFTYVEDPSTPFSTVGSGGAVDTVRFPRDTLSSGAGDCDDTTALLLSCLEAAGIPCAILTSPGHVFLAMQADGPPSGPGMPDPAYGFIQADSSWWIPLESTVLSKGFAEVWRQGYAIAAKAGKELEVVPLSEARLAYPSMPLPGSPLMPPVAPRSGFDKLTGLSAEIFKGLFAAPAGKLAESASKGKPKAQAYNNWGIRLAQFGYYSEAIAALKKALAEDKTLAVAWINLVGVLRLSGDEAAAETTLASALKELPSSATLKRFAERSSTTVITAAPGGGSASRGSDAGAFDFDWGE